MLGGCCWEELNAKEFMMESCCQGVAVVWVSLDSRSGVGLLGQSCCELLWGAGGGSFCWGDVGEEPLVESCCWEAVVGELS